MYLKSIFYNVKNATLEVAWFSGDNEEDYNRFRSSEPAVPEFYQTLMELGRKIWNQYLNLSERGITFELSKIRKNVAVVRIVWQHPTEVKDVLYAVKMGLVYRQSEKIAIPLPLPKISILVHRDEKMTVEQLRENYYADPELQAMLEKMEKLGLSYAMGERAQVVLPGMEKEAEEE
ncbi:MAG: hypothetical protein IKZ43_07395 [Acidaminococcaceae bacterium]|nr:hypothetical protein [Acidaminococcaceae bacterium]